MTPSRGPGTDRLSSSEAGRHERNTGMINFGRNELYALHDALIEHFNGAVSELTTAEMACNAFLAEAFELEVTEHGGLDAEKIKEYKALCREFLDYEKEIAENRDIHKMYTELQEAYAEFLETDYPVWQDEMYEFCYWENYVDV